MNKKSAIFVAVLSVFGVANAQNAATATETHPAPAAGTPAVQHVVETPASHPATPVAHPPVAETHATQQPVATQPAVEAPVAQPVVTQPVAEIPVAAEPVPAPAPEATLVVEAPAAQKPAGDDVKKPKKKRHQNVKPKNDFAIVDVPATFEIQARKVMELEKRKEGVKSSENNLDTWWGRANLQLVTKSENFEGKIHLRMYPGEFKGNKLKTIDDKDKDKNEFRDYFQLYEAWAWQRGDYMNFKIGRWEHTTRFGSMAYGGYIDAKKDSRINEETYKSELIRRRAEGFISTFDPENAIQFGFNNFAENVSFDLALISSDRNLNKGDIRAYFSFKELAEIENFNVGVGYRSNVFDALNNNKRCDITHTMDFGFNVPILRNLNIIKSLNFFFETALIGMDDQVGEMKGASAYQGDGKNADFDFPLLFGFDLALFRGMDRVVFEAEYDGNRPENSDMKNPEKKKDWLLSIYLKKVLNDRFALHLGINSENNSKDFSLNARLQGRIN